MPPRVFKVEANARPPKGRFRHYAPLVCSDRQMDWLGTDNFSGRPFPKKWRPLEVRISLPRLPRPDFFNFGVDVFVCNARAVELAGDAMEMAGELLPVTIKGEAGRFYIFNVTNCVD